MDEKSNVAPVTRRECDLRHSPLKLIEKRLTRIEVMVVGTLLSALGTIITLYVTFLHVPS